VLFDWWWFENEIVKKTTRYWGSTLEFLMSHCVNNFKTLQHGIAADSEQEKNEGIEKCQVLLNDFFPLSTKNRSDQPSSSLRTLFFLAHSIQDCDKNLKLNFHFTVCSQAKYNEWVIPCSDYYHSCVRRSRIFFSSLQPTDTLLVVAITFQLD